MNRPLGHLRLNESSPQTIAAAAPETGPGASEGRDPVSILLVDDQPAKLLIYEVILKELGENLVKATSAREALDHLLKADVAVVLMDVSMPEIDGFELADMIRQHPRFQKTPIIFVSAVHMTDVDRIRGYQIGAVDYISVPVIPDVLRAKVSVFAELHRKTRQLQELNRELEARVAQRSQQLHVLNGQLQERVAELESIMQVLPMGVAIAHDANCELITGNAALTEMLGARLGENLAWSFRPGGKYQAYDNGWLIDISELPMQKSVRIQKSTGLAELEIRTGESTLVSVLASASPLFDEIGNVRGAVGVFFDVTERKRMEDILRERAELLDLATEAIMVRDSSGAIRFWNAGAESLYGWHRSEVLGFNAHQLLATRFPIAEREIADTLATQGRWEGNLSQTAKDGREIVVASRQALKLNSALVLEINRDITSQLIAEEALRRNDRLAAMGKVAGIVAHEINNPLEAITNVFYLLREHPTLDEQARYYAQLAEQELERVSHITRQTLSFYRESNRAISVSLAELLDDVLELQQRTLQSNLIAVERRYITRGQVQGFPVELKQVFLNLIANAIQAMPNGGRLRVSVGPAVQHNTRPAGVRVSITDNGGGIRPADAKRIFEPFFTTKSTKGTGLGLWISRGIVQKYDGTLHFRSVLRTSGAATTFQIFLPAS
jgi:PAS domain S-box-containing protein